MTEVKQGDRLKSELEKMGIRSEADLREAIHKLPALQIGIMTDPIKNRTRKGAGIYGRHGRQ